MDIVTKGRYRLYRIYENSSVYDDHLRCYVHRQTHVVEICINNNLYRHLEIYELVLGLLLVKLIDNGVHRFIVDGFASLL